MRAKKFSPRKVDAMSTPTPEAFKQKVAVIRKFLKAKYNVDVSQGHGLDLVSQLYGFKDWNTASAASKPFAKVESDKVVRIRTVGGMRKALAPFPDSAKLDAFDNLVIKNFIEAMAEIGVTEGSLNSEYSFILADDSTPDAVGLILKLEEQHVGEWDDTIETATDWDWERDSDVE